MSFRLFLMLVFTLGVGAPPAEAKPGRADCVPGEVLVATKSTVAPGEALAIARGLRAVVVQRFPKLGVYRLRLPAGTTTEAAIGALGKNPHVRYAQPNFRYRADRFPQDPDFDDLWGLHNTGQSGGHDDADIDAPEAWDLTTGARNVVVAVIDTGIDYDHPDLAPNLWTNPGEVPDNNLDDDNNGFVDDVHGCDAINDDGDPRDDNGHGTHVAGTIGAVGNNRIGVAGVAWDVQIIACKFLGSDGSGDTAGAIACLEYLHQLKDRGVDVIATNNSWGSDENDRALEEAIERSNARGILFVASAGNAGTNNDVNSHYPSSHPNENIIAVAATERRDQRPSWSCYGATRVDLGAPGTDIWSTQPSGGYAWLSGTSMAAPQVTGAVVLLRAFNPALTHRRIKDLLLATGDPVPDLQNRTVSGRRLNVYNALVASTLPALQVAISANQTADSSGAFVFITVRVTDAASGVVLEGVSVDLVIQTPAGQTHQITGTTAADGIVRLRYRPTPADASGMADVVVTASRSGYSSHIALASFVLASLATPF